MASERRQKFLKELAQKIRSAEGTSDERAIKEGYKSGYDVTLGYGAYDGDSDKPVSNMTLSELKDFQKQMINRSKGKIKGTKYGSSAAGAYQFTRSTLFGKNGLVKKAGLSMDDTFSPETQDKLYEALLEQDKVVSKLQQGKPKAAQKAVANRWASMTDASGNPSYEQNRSDTAKAQDKEVKDLFYNTAEGFILNKEEPMAKEKKKEDKGPIGGMSLMDPIQQIMNVDLAEKPKMSKMPDEQIARVMRDVVPKDDPVAAQTMRNNLLVEGDQEQTTSGAPVSPAKVLQEKIGTKLQENKEQAERKPASIEQRQEKENKRFQLSQSMKDALSYFGPRMGALLLGGVNAMEITDQIMSGYETQQRGRTQDRQRAQQLEQQDEMTPYQKEQLRLRQESLDLRRQALDPSQSAEQEAVKLTEKQQDTLDKIDDTLGSMATARQFLKKGNLTGFFDNYIRGAADKFSGNPRAYGRKVLEKLRVDDALIRIGQTKGAISDKEMGLFLSPAPTLNDQEDVWLKWISEREAAAKKIRERIKTGKRAENPASSNQVNEFMGSSSQEDDDALINKYY